MNEILCSLPGFTVSFAKATWEFKTTKVRVRSPFLQVLFPSKGKAKSRELFLPLEGILQGLSVRLILRQIEGELACLKVSRW